MIFNTLTKFIQEKGLSVVKATIREEDKFGVCIATSPINGFTSTYHFNKNKHSWE